VRFEQQVKDKMPEQPRQDADRQKEFGPAGNPALAIGGEAAAAYQ
jgi:hypothetical protein